MTPKSAKAKGRRLQQDIRDALIETFALDPELVKCAIMGEKGTDVKVLGTTPPNPLHISIEAKAVEAFSLYACWKQAVTNATADGRRPVLVARRNNSPAMAVTTLEDYIILLYLAWKGKAWTAHDSTKS